jgi:hypothetical protein
MKRNLRHKSAVKTVQIIRQKKKKINYLGKMERSAQSTGKKKKKKKPN